MSANQKYNIVFFQTDEYNGSIYSITIANQDIPNNTNTYQDLSNFLRNIYHSRTHSRINSPIRAYLKGPAQNSTSIGITDIHQEIDWNLITNFNNRHQSFILAEVNMNRDYPSTMHYNDVGKFLNSIL